MTDLVTMGAFSKVRGVTRTTVARWRDEGRIVMENGRVNVAESEAMLEKTSGARPDVAARHEASRRAKAAGEVQPQSFQDARAMNEHYKALKAQAEYEQMIGNLIAREDVDGAMKNLGAAVRAALDVLPDQATPLVTPITDLHEVHALLADACRNVLHGLEEAVKREQRQMRKDHS